MMNRTKISNYLKYALYLENKYVTTKRKIKIYKTLIQPELTSELETQVGTVNLKTEKIIRINHKEIYKLDRIWN